MTRTRLGDITMKTGDVRKLSKASEEEWQTTVAAGRVVLGTKQAQQRAGSNSRRTSAGAELVLQMLTT